MRNKETVLFRERHATNDFIVKRVKVTPLGTMTQLNLIHVLDSDMHTGSVVVRDSDEKHHTYHLIHPIEKTGIFLDNRNLVGFNFAVSGLE